MARSEIVAATKAQILIALAGGPKTQDALRDLLGIEPVTGEGAKRVSNCLYGMKAAGQVRRALGSKLWELVDAEATAGSAGSSVGTAELGATPPPPRSTVAGIPSRTGSPKCDASLPPRKERASTPPPPELPEAAANGTAKGAKNIQDIIHAASGPNAQASATPPPAAPESTGDIGRRGREVNGTAPASAEPTCTAGGGDGHRRSKLRNFARCRCRARRARADLIHIHIDVTLGPRALVELGDEAGEVLRAAVILIRAEEQLRTRQDGPA